MVPANSPNCVNLLVLQLTFVYEIEIGIGIETEIEMNEASDQKGSEQNSAYVYTHTHTYLQKYTGKPRLPQAMSLSFREAIDDGQFICLPLSTFLLWYLFASVFIFCARQLHPIEFSNSESSTVPRISFFLTQPSKILNLTSMMSSYTTFFPFFSFFLWVKLELHKEFSELLLLNIYDQL